eukprot:NODE_1224_length_1512_cov_23.427888_g1019_i0.p9 GENE.NODE_1224_length_1512_cov_23.427888_g1019_i0~~NODE_1224_length_1512_cov_23.427888_g1019_i0.p9  ORF type:complete len:59 (+),score=4.79 NODE_1224_length_1512_cov_23.427888_g1019_i0:712-888(+)
MCEVAHCVHRTEQHKQHRPFLFGHVFAPCFLRSSTSEIDHEPPLRSLAQLPKRPAAKT